jgi:uncharacterized membrane protein YqhA
MIENLFEAAMWKTRFLVLSAVIFGLIGALVLFVVASMDIYGVAAYAFNTIVASAHPEHFHEDIVSGIIGAVDLYLIAVVMLIFSFGDTSFSYLQLTTHKLQKMTQKFYQSQH